MKESRMPPAATERLARFIVEARYEDLPEVAVERARVLFLDTIGVALAGAVVGDTGSIIFKYVKETGGNPQATVLGSGFRSSTPNAALANALLGHALDFDDWERSGHPSCMMVATSLAEAEHLGLSGKHVLLAYVLGVEIYDKIASGFSDLRESGWHGTGIFGTLGSAAAAAKLLGLDVEQTVMALGIAASSASGLMREHGSMTKPYTAGKAARNGLEAALLAKDGFTSRQGILEMSLGFCEAFQGKPGDYEKMTRNLGQPFHIVSPGLGIKAYPCRIPEYRGLQALLEIMNEHPFTPGDVDSMDFLVSRRKYAIDNFDPQTGLEGKFSNKYVAARLVLDKTLTHDSFTDEKVQEPRARDLMARITISLDETVNDPWSEKGPPVTVRLKDGHTFRRQVDITPGSPENPLPLSQVKEKYCHNAALVLASDKVQPSMNMILNLDQAPNLAELMTALAPGALKA